MWLYIILSIYILIGGLITFCWLYIVHLPEDKFQEFYNDGESDSLVELRDSLFACDQLGYGLIARLFLGMITTFLWLPILIFK